MQFIKKFQSNWGDSGGTKSKFQKLYTLETRKEKVKILA